MTAEHADPSGSAVSVIEYEVQEGEAGDAGIIIIIIIIIVIIIIIITIIIIFIIIIGQERQARSYKRCSVRIVSPICNTIR